MGGKLLFSFTRTSFLLVMLCMQKKYPPRTFANMIAVVLLSVCLGALTYLLIRVYFEKKNHALSWKAARVFKEVYSFVVDVLFLMAEVVVIGLFGASGNIVIIAATLLIMGCARIIIKNWISKWKHTCEDSISALMLSRMTEEQIRTLSTRGELTLDENQGTMRNLRQQKDQTNPRNGKKQTKIVRFDRYRAKGEKTKRRRRGHGIYGRTKKFK